MISHGRGKENGVVNKTYEVVASIQPPGTIGSVVYLLATTLYKKSWYEPQGWHYMLVYRQQYIDDVISLKNSKLGDFIDRIYSYPNEVERIPQIQLGILYILT